MDHPSHKLEVTRLKRLQGQVSGILRMVEEERYCVDILTQIRAVQAALRRVELNILERHVHHCVQDAARAGDPEAEAKLDELFGLLKRFGS